MRRLHPVALPEIQSIYILSLHKFVATYLIVPAMNNQSAYQLHLKVLTTTAWHIDVLVNLWICILQADQAQ